MKQIIIQTPTRQVQDKLKLTGSILTINGIDFDLNNPQPLQIVGKDEQDNDIFASPEDQRVYLQDAKIHALMFVDRDHQYIASEMEQKKYFDRDLNGMIDLEEFSSFIDCLNKPVAEMQKELKVIRDSFIKARMDEGMTEKEAIIEFRKKGIVKKD